MFFEEKKLVNYFYLFIYLFSVTGENVRGLKNTI